MSSSFYRHFCHDLASHIGIREFQPALDEAAAKMNACKDAVASILEEKQEFYMSLPKGTLPRSRSVTILPEDGTADNQPLADGGDVDNIYPSKNIGLFATSLYVPATLYVPAELYRSYVDASEEYGETRRTMNYFMATTEADLEQAKNVRAVMKAWPNELELITQIAEECGLSTTFPRPIKDLLKSSQKQLPPPEEVTGEPV